MAVPVQVIRLGVIGVVIAGFITFKYVAAGMVEDKIGGAMAKAGIPSESVSYDASVDLFGFNVHLEDVVIDIPGKDKMKIDEITINNFDSEHTIPEFINIEVEGIDGKILFASSPLAKVSKNLFEEQDEVKLNFAVNYEFDADDKTLNIKEVSQSIDNLGEVSFSTVLHNVNSIENFVQRMMMNPSSMEVGKSSLEYEDDSLVEKIIAFNAEKKGISADKYKEDMLAGLKKELEQVNEKEDSDLEQDLLALVIDFVQSPDELEISIDPKEPMSLREITRGNPSDTLKKLNLEIN